MSVASPVPGVPVSAPSILRPPEQQVRSRNLNWLGARAKDNCDSARPQTLDGVRDRPSPGRTCHQDDCRAAERQQGIGRAAGAIVDVVMSTKFPCQVRLVSPSSDCGNFEAHVACILQSEMPKPADPEDSDKVARFRGCIT